MSDMFDDFQKMQRHIRNQQAIILAATEVQVVKDAWT